MTIMDAIMVVTMYGGFIAVGFGVSAIVRALFPQWWEKGQENE